MLQSRCVHARTCRVDLYSMQLNIVFTVHIFNEEIFTKHQPMHTNPTHNSSLPNATSRDGQIGSLQRSGSFITSPLGDR
jgi:hypothetical protein